MSWKSVFKRSWLGGRLFWRLPSALPRVAVTFDDGPHPEFTPRVLDTLKEHGVKASFFCIGQAARQRPDLVRRIVEEGHTLGCHTETHADLAKVGSRRSWEECKTAKAALEEIGGKPVRYLRPPFGHMGLTTVPISLAQKMRVAMWSFDSQDYEGHSPEELLRRLCAQPMGPGGIALFHDVGENTAEALPAILEELKSRGLECVSLDTLAG